MKKYVFCHQIPTNILLQSRYWCFLIIFYGIYIIYDNPGLCTTDTLENLKGLTQEKFISWSHNVCS